MTSSHSQKDPARHSGIFPFRVFCLLITIHVFSQHSFAQPGSLDMSFGNSGIVVQALGNFGDKANAMAIQADQKIVLAGSIQSSFTASDFAVLRYNPDGTPDSTFGTNGLAIAAIEDRSEAAALGIQSDGKIVLGGYSRRFLNAARFHPNGSLDTTFGTGGILITDVPGHYDDQCTSIAIQDDGKIIAGGYAQHNSNDQSYLLLVRYLPDGGLDSTFGTNGIVIGDTGEANSVIIQTDGKILLCGTFDFQIIAERFHSDGSPDSAFATNGRVTTATGSSAEGRAMALQTDGKILLSGLSRDGTGTSECVVVRYDPNGTLDQTFGTGGIVKRGIGDGSEAHSLGIQANGNILIGGFAIQASNPRHFAAARFHPDGSPDTTFGIGGEVITPIGPSYSICTSLGIQNNGKIVLVGYTHDGSTLDIAMVRYNGDPDMGSGLDCCEQVAFRIYPNPVRDEVTFEVGVPVRDATLFLVNALWQAVRRMEHISGSEIQISCSELPAGMYFIRLTESNSVIATGKLQILGD